MNDQRLLLEIRLDGEAVGPGRIPVSHLLLFLPNLNKALQRVGRVLLGDSNSLRRGPPPQSIVRGLQLDLVSLREGSPAAVLAFERTKADSLFPEFDFGKKIIETALNGLNTLQENNPDRVFPTGYDQGVLAAWCDAGKVLNRGIERIIISLNTQKTSIRSTLNADSLIQIGKHISGPQ